MTEQEAIDLYQSGLSSIEIAEMTGLSPRTIQRAMKKAGVIRNAQESFRNAIKRGRMVYTRMPEEQLKQRKYIAIKVRYQVLSRDGFACVKCGNKASSSRIQIDHIDNNPLNNSLDNLQTLCELCNKGKAYNGII